ncbi:putative globin [Trichinella spiralis]|nr:putative globin [Trichinella spiralis]XP_003375097.1 putative globin [Trichinella spiralis]
MSQPPQVLALDTEQLRLQTAGKEPNKNQLSPCSPTVKSGPQKSGRRSEKQTSPARQTHTTKLTTPAVTTSVSSSNLQELRYSSLSVRLNLTIHQRNLLAQSWPKVQLMNRIQGGDAFFRKFCEKSPTGWAMFEKAKVVERFAKGPANTGVMRRHEQLLTDLIGQAVEKINEPSEPFLQTCYNYGAAHANISVGFMEDCIWEQLAEAVLDRINMVGLVRKHRDLSKAWTLLVTVIVEKIKDGYLQRHKQHSREAAKRETVRRESSF